MANRIRISDHFYLWVPQTGVTSQVVISCHGGTLETYFMVPRGTRFKFYSPPTRSAQGKLEKTLYDDMVKDDRTFDHQNANHNMMEDYTLSKFQGRHGGNSETYGDIRTFVDEYKISVLSIRNRKSWFVKKSDSMTYLSRAVGLIETLYPDTVREYRCLFCRSEYDPVYYRDMFTGEAYRG